VTNLERASAWALILATIGVVVSAVLAYFAYVHETRKGTEEFTLEVASRLQRGHLQEAQVRLFLEVQSVQRTIHPAKLGSDDLRVYFAKSDYSANTLLVSDLLSLVAFFNNAEECAKAQICDAELLSKLVSQSATGIKCTFSGLLSHLSKEANVPNLGSGVAFFANGSC
jgi:hypothetical protein